MIELPSRPPTLHLKPMGKVETSSVLRLALKLLLEALNFSSCISRWIRCLCRFVGLRDEPCTMLLCSVCFLCLFSLDVRIYTVHIIAPIFFTNPM